MRSTIMRNTLATAALSLGLSCAFMLANAQDATLPPQESSSEQSAGQLGVETESFGGTEGIDSDPNVPTLPGQDRWVGASMCTDGSGLSYRRGTRGFERCVESKRAQSASQAAGEAGEPQTDSMTGPVGEEIPPGVRNDPNDSSTRGSIGSDPGEVNGGGLNAGNKRIGR